ncbi:MAG: hypothetical protein A2452_01630 [Candidatus Firestonebacteria bacterium RIFOXYC2_FULL_39_67]|nr:MAG: hypothetical protein A2536_00725 [Candidatus Firestonebacteria bacterium RIFOXYD2_FULL_39_29]OGF52357.1 MAG: hypothetical protein A2497_05880 [Candidatus Firestonebacteria bacterium RifOxyC12_full_39_7]OGF53650.1 MAG: hypothetical protein A2452_01630 [Candidatus Firestonebacteria bacterium RIFOXYC2_FULL_39_67]
MILKLLPSPRLVVFVAAGILLLLAGEGLGTSLLLFYDALLLLIVFFDLLLTPHSKSLSAERIVEERLSLGGKNPVTIKIKNNSTALLEFTVEDETPPDFEVIKGPNIFSVPPDSSGSFTYHITPPERGDFSFGDIYFRYFSPLRLLIIHDKFKAKNNIRVYPNVLEIRKYGFLALRNRLIDIGLKHTKYRGVGTEFETLRDYTFDDDFRWIDWKATARRQKPTVRQHEIEQNQNVIIMLDAGRLMLNAVEGMYKIDYAINATLMLAFIAINKSDNIGIIVFSDKIEAYVPPKKDKKQLSRISESLYNIKAKMAESDYKRAFLFAKSKNKKRSLFVVITDLIDLYASKNLINNVKSLKPMHAFLFTALKDPALTEISLSSPSTLSEVYRKAAACDLLTKRRTAVHELKSAGGFAFDVHPKDLTVNLVNSYIEIKERL